MVDLYMPVQNSMMSVQRGTKRFYKKESSAGIALTNRQEKETLEPLSQLDYPKSMSVIQCEKSSLSISRTSYNPLTTDVEQSKVGEQSRFSRRSREGKECMNVKERSAPKIYM